MSPQVWIVIGIINILLFFIGRRIGGQQSKTRREIRAFTELIECAKLKIFPWPEEASAEDQVRGLEDLKAGRRVVWYHHKSEEA